MAKFYAVYLFAADLQAFRSVSDEAAAIVLIPPPGIGSVSGKDVRHLRPGWRTSRAEAFGMAGRCAKRRSGRSRLQFAGQCRALV